MRALSNRAADPIVGGRRFIFLVPQERPTLVGTWYAPSDGDSEEDLIERGAAACSAEFRAACPALELTAADVVGGSGGCFPSRPDGSGGGRTHWRTGIVS